MVRGNVAQPLPNQLRRRTANPKHCCKLLNCNTGAVFVAESGEPRPPRQDCKGPEVRRQRTARAKMYLILMSGNDAPESPVILRFRYRASAACQGAVVPTLMESDGHG